jgi:hypothetical protein
MAENSFKKLVDAKGHLYFRPGIGPTSKAISYNAIRALVNQFNRASDPAKKSQILNEIIKKITLARRLQESPTRTETMRAKTAKKG